MKFRLVSEKVGGKKGDYNCKTIIEGVFRLFFPPPRACKKELEILVKYVSKQATLVCLDTVYRTKKPKVGRGECFTLRDWFHPPLPSCVQTMKALFHCWRPSSQLSIFWRYSGVTESKMDRKNFRPGLKKVKMDWGCSEKIDQDCVTAWV